MGYYTKYFSTLFKGTRATAWKERVEARRAIRQLRIGDVFYEKAMGLIEEHRVTAALRKIRTAIKSLANSAKNADAFIFNVVTQDDSQAKAELDILKALMELSQVIPKGDATLLKLERNLILAVLVGTQKDPFAEKGERAEYRQVELITNEAENDKERLMGKLRLMFQKKDTVSILSRIPMRRGASRQKTDILGLRNVAKKIRSLKARFKPNREKAAEQELVVDTQEVVADLKDAFRNSYLIKKRDLIIILKILYDLHSLRLLILNSIEKHYLPQQPGNELIDEIGKIESTIVKDFHPVAQGFRIVIAKIDDVKREAGRDIRQLAA